MTDALLSAVLAAPDDDVARLRYAAAARARGEAALADLIELQCAFASAALGSREREQLWLRAHDAARAYAGPDGETWAAANGLTRGVWRARLERGFVHRVEVRGAKPEDLVRLAALQPVRELALQPSAAAAAAENELPALLASALIPRLRALELSRFSAKADVASALAAAPPLPALRALTISACKLDDASARRLARAALGGLSELALTANTFRARGLAALLDAFGEGLRRLRISEHAIDAKLVGALTQTSRLGSLEELVLDGVKLEEPWVRELFEATSLARARIVLKSHEVPHAAWPLLSARNPSCRLALGGVDTGGGTITIALAVENPSADILSAMKPSLAVRGRASDHGLSSFEMAVDGRAWNGIDAFSIEPGARRAITLRLARTELARFEDHVAPGAWGLALSMTGAGTLFVQIAR